MGCGRGTPPGRGDGVPLPTGGRGLGEAEFFLLLLVYKWLVLVHSETNLYTGRVFTMFH